MKKAMFLLIVLGGLVFGANAFALTSNVYENEIELNTTLNQNKESTVFTFEDITGPFLTANTVLSWNGKGSVELFLGEKWLGKLTTDIRTYTFDQTSLENLNAAIAINEGSVEFILKRSTGTSSITSAKLTGTVAPEPGTLALVGAGLVALPLARRLRKSFGARV